MKKYILLLAIAGFAFTACQKEIGTEVSAEAEGPLRTLVFDGTDALTKMAIGSYSASGTPAAWEEGDAIVVRKTSDGSSVGTSTVDAGGSQYGKFTISTSAPAGTSVRVIYPYTDTLGGGTLPTTQTHKSATTKALNYTHAYSDVITLPESGTVNFGLKHALATVRVVYRPDPEGVFAFPSGNQGFVSVVTIRTIDSPLSGDYTVDYETGKVTPGANTKDYVEAIGRTAGFNVSGSNFSTFTTFPTNGVKQIEVMLHIYHTPTGGTKSSWDVPVLFKGEIKAGELNVFDLGKVSLKPEYLSTNKDYYAKWLSGQDIMIGDRVINKTNFPTATLVKAADLTETILNDGGLIFVDDKSASNNRTETTGGQMNDLTKKGETVIIGRWKDAGSQPNLKLKELRISANDLSLLNVKLTSMRTSGGNVFGMNGASTAFTQLRVVDCFIDASNTGNVVDPKATKNGFAMKTIYFDNCIIDMPVNKANSAGTTSSSSTCAFMKTSSSKADSLAGPMHNYTVKNCVLFTSENTPVTEHRVYVTYLASLNMSKTNLVFEHNTLTNFQNHYGIFFFSAGSFNSFSAKNNLCFVEGAAGSAETNNNMFRHQSKPAFTETPVIDYNFMARNGSIDANLMHPSYKFPAASIGANNLDTSNGTVSAITDVFSAKNYATGYFVIDQSKVTNGAGAYTEKKFISSGL